mmetsp:Transcript_25274/g.69677  ORF Transcript_25274/g.69677 Transcript_25274/m.69677 type:complete len:644 (+) Transcript_25274:152-2083(+)
MGKDHQNRRSQTKRRFRLMENSHNEEKLEIVDDLAHAAQFAIIPNAALPAAACLGESVDPMKNQDDGNEIEVDDDDSESDASIDDATDMADSARDDDGDSDHDESDDEDLVEAMRRMNEATAAEEEARLTVSNAPKTENEVDGYKIPIQELESQLQIRLTVDDGTTAVASSNKNKDIPANQLSLAGRIKNYMVMDRTVVVQSISSGSQGTQQSRGPLDEGSLLVIKKHAVSDDSVFSDDTDSGCLIPLGRIFEVFGPVSQPLYTIRLPSPPSALKNNQKASNSKTSKKHSIKQSSNSNGKSKETELDEEDGIPADDSDQNVTKANEKNEEPREGNSSSDVLSKPESSDNANGEDAMNESPSSFTELDPVGKKKGSECENRDISQQQISEKTEQIEDEKGSSSNVESAAPGGIDSPPENSVVDLWAKDGEYAKFLSQNKDIEVYYIQDEAKLIDTAFVMRSSGKGCDASNMYDEEIVNSSEAYYSDDEKEREAKNKKKGTGRKKKQQRNNDRQRQIHQNNFRTFQSNAAPGYYGQRPPPPPPPPQTRGYGQRPDSVPQGFHQTAQQQYQQAGGQKPYPTYQYPPQSMFHRQAPGIPPPPPPPGYNQPYQYQGTLQPPPGSQSMSTMAPPPPPPRNPNEPPAYQY